MKTIFMQFKKEVGISECFFTNIDSCFETGISNIRYCSCLLRKNNDMVGNGTMKLIAIFMNVYDK